MWEVNLHREGTFCDIEHFVAIRSVFLPHRIFIIGNAWGFSTLVLANIFRGVAIDVIDAIDAVACDVTLMSRAHRRTVEWKPWQIIERRDR